MPEKSIKALNIISIAYLVLSVLGGVLLILNGDSGLLFLAAIWIIAQGIFIFCMTKCVIFITEKISWFSYRLEEEDKNL